MSLLAAHPAARADTANHECDSHQDITVVVDFQELIDGNNNDVNVRCAPQPVDSGFDALNRADISYQTYRAFVCRIAGLPTADDEPCNRFPPANAYWVYWYAEPGGQWTYSQYGADARTPPPGSFEGWSFAKDRNSSALPPPRYPTPKAIPTTTTEAPAPGSPQPTTAAATATTRGSRPTSTASTGAANATTTSTTTASDVEVAASPSPSSSIALGHVDLSVDHADKGSPLAFVLGAAGVVLVAGVGVALARARRARA